MKTLSSALALGLLLAGVSASAQVSTPEVNDSIQNDVSAPLGNMVMRSAVRPFAARESAQTLRPKLERLTSAARRSSAPSPRVPFSGPSNAVVPANQLFSPPINGVGNGFPNYFVPDAPTDVNAAVGDTQVVQWVNVSYAVFDKKTGKLLAGPIEGGQFWTGFGGRCESHNDGDPIVTWDKLAHRWVVSQNVFNLGFLTCIAVSTTADATGTWNRYVFPQLGGLPDYPKLGVHPDAYFQSQNAFSGGPGGGRYMGAHVCAYDRAKMLAGRRARQVCFQTGTFDDSLLPADLDSPRSPTPRLRADDGDNDDGDGRHYAPEVFLGSIDNFDPANSNVIYQYLFHVDFLHPGLSTFKGAGGTMPITVTPFGLACGGFGSCIEQPDVSDTLDSLGDRLMYRLAYRNFGDHQSWVVSHSVTSPSGQVGERWYEFRAAPSSTNLSVYQQGTFAPDGAYRWMGSLAMDKMGNIALGYSLSSVAVHPSIYFTGRTAGDPLGTLGAEQAILIGGGSQYDTYSRWGDYTSMALDTDECTFWYTNQYYLGPAPDAFNWSTAVQAIRFNNCR